MRKILVPSVRTTRHASERTRTAAQLIPWLAVIALAAAESAEANWPQFRGPGMDGVATDNENLPEEWSPRRNIEWKAEIPGLGWSSPVVHGTRVFLTTAVAEGQVQPGTGLYDDNLIPGAGSELGHSWRVYCLDLETGEVLWWKEVYAGVPDFTRHDKNTYASETPVTDGERVYARFGDLGLWALDVTDGTELWEVLTPHARTTGWGSGSSPVLVDDLVILAYDDLKNNSAGGWLAAYDKSDGSRQWRVSRGDLDRLDRSTWATPFVWKNSQRTEIVMSGVRWINAYDPATGNRLWQLRGRMSWAAIPTPVAVGDLLYVNSGYHHDDHRPVYAIRAGGSGDITLDEGETSSDYVAWYAAQAGNYLTSPLVHDGIYYGVQSRGTIEAYEADTGTEIYRERIRVGAYFTASPWTYNGKIFALSEDGDTYVIEPGRTYRQIRVNSLGTDDDPEMVLASPAVVGERLLIRTKDRVYSIKKPEPENSGPATVGTIAAMTLRVGTAETVDVADSFHDADSDPLTYTAESSDATVATVAVSGSTLTVTPAAAGGTSVTVTAEDGEASAMQTFAVTVVANRAPTASDTALPDLRLTITAGARTLDVSSAFTEPDGDSLSYGAASSDTTVATSSMAGSAMTVTPITIGTATMTVTASDGNGGSASRSFAVVVQTANRPPEVTNSLPDVKQRASERRTVPVANAFADPDQDPLSYQATSSDTSVATVSVANSVVVVEAASSVSGLTQTTVTVVAQDPGGLTGSLAFQVNVTGSSDGGGGGGGGGGSGRNRTPVAVGALPNLALAAGSEALVDVEGAFRDPDGDTLSYEVESSDPAVAAAVAQSAVVTVTAMDAGEAQVTVTATDPRRRSATQIFMVTVACAFEVAPLRQDVLWTATRRAVTVDTMDHCTWTASSEDTFLTVPPETATGPGTLTYAVMENTAAARTGELLVAGQQVTVFQASRTAFTEDPLERGVTPVRAIHFLELRARIDALRVREGLEPFAWTDEVLMAAVTPVKGVHVTELQDALAEVYAAAGQNLVPLVTGTGIMRAEDLMWLRRMVAGMERVRG